MSSSSRHISSILFRHVLREFLLPLTCAILAFAFLFMVNNVFDDLQDFTSHDAPIGQFILYLFALQPHHLLNVIPISILLATSFMTVMLGRNNELCAMRTAGLSLAVCALPVWLFAVAACLVVGAIGESWGKSSLEFAHTIQIKYCGLNQKNRQPIAFTNHIQHRDWLLQPTGDGVTFSDAIIRQFDEYGKTHWVLAAKEASFSQDTNWTFHNGIQEYYDHTGNIVKTTHFQNLVKDYNEHPGDFITISDTTQMPSIRQTWDMLNRPVKLPERTVQKLRTILWYNITFPLASLVAALFGFSMTIANQRSEIMRGFAGAIGMLVLFYIIGQVMFVVGKNGWLPPFIAGALPSLAFTAGGIYNVWRKQ